MIGEYGHNICGLYGDSKGTDDLRTGLFIKNENINKRKNRKIKSIFP
jgi:hypothetical protein